MSKINEEISKDEPYLEEKDVGKKEFIVKQNIQIQVQYKIIADDKDEAMEKMLNEYMFDISVPSSATEETNLIYDFCTKNYGHEPQKEFWSNKEIPEIEKTGKKIVKIFSEEKIVDGKLNPDFDEKDFDIKVGDLWD